MSVGKKILNIIGVLLMVAVIAVTIPLNVPKWFGLQIYEVLSGSMEPKYPIGSVVYVEAATVADVSVGDAITYTLGTGSEYVMTHRVTQILSEEKSFVTKGDANEAEDIDPVYFDRLIGKPCFCIPYLGYASDYFHTGTGKAICLCIFIAALLMWLFAEFHSGKVLRFIAIGMVTFGVAGLVLVIIDYRRGDMEYEHLQEFVTEGDTKVENVAGNDAETPTEEIFVPNAQISQKLKELREKNVDVVAWIAFDELKINYPVMQAEDNYYYLTHTFSGAENKAGSVFLDAGDTPDFMDYHSLMYGHNMKNGSMFGRLKKYYEEEFYQGNQFFTIYVEDQAYRYEIFSVHTVPETDEVYTIWFAPGERSKEYREFVGRMKRTSWYDTGVDVTEKDKIVTLSTCTASDDRRFVVHGKLVAVYQFEIQ